MNGTVVENEDEGLVLHNGPVDRVEAAQEADEVAAVLGRAGTDDQLARGEIEGTDHGSFAGLPRRLDPQIASPLGPSAIEVGMGKGLRTRRQTAK